jgi:hypothetical protein
VRGEAIAASQQRRQHDDARTANERSRPVTHRTNPVPNPQRPMPRAPNATLLATAFATHKLIADTDMLSSSTHSSVHIEDTRTSRTRAHHINAPLDRVNASKFWSQSLEIAARLVSR